MNVYRAVRDEIQVKVRDSSKRFARKVDAASELDRLQHDSGLCSPL